MKLIYLKFSAFLLMCVLFACTKEEDEQPMDFKINGVKDFSVSLNSTTNRAITFYYLGGTKEKVSISYSGLPNGVSILNDPNEGIPDFLSNQIFVVNNPDTGYFQIKLIASTPLGAIVEKSFVLHVKPTANISPVIYLSGSNPMDIVLNSTYNEPGFNAVDVEDGNLNQFVTFTSNVNPDSVGSYKVTYKVNDSAGAIDSIVRIVNVKSSLGFLSGQYSCTTIDIASGNTRNWITSASPSVTDNTKLKLFKISDCFMADPILNVDLSNLTIDLPSQTFYAMSSTDTTNHSFVGNGTITMLPNANVIVINYNVSYFSNSLGQMVTEARRDSLIK